MNESIIDTVLDSENFDIDSVTYNMHVHDNECGTCLKQFSCVRNRKQRIDLLWPDILSGSWKTRVKWFDALFIVDIKSINA